MSLLKQAWGGLVHLLYPGLCGMCRGLLSEDEPHFCTECRAALTHDDAETCPRCAATVGPFADVGGGCISCREQRLHFDRAFRLGPYDGLLREAVLRMK